MQGIAKAYAMTDAKISFVSLVDKAANKKQFLITKADDGSAKFSSFGRIVKMDTDAHYVTGIVYEPLVEDTDGNYMTEAEITKAAYWFAKNGNNVDLQHCFEKCEGADVVESYVAKCDMEIEGEQIQKGTWLMTMEIANDDVWDSIQKGDITGFSMGGVGVYSEEDIDITQIEKSDEPKGIFKRFAKAMGFDVIEKGVVKEKFKRRVKSENFYSAFYSLKDTLLDVYNPTTGTWGDCTDESVIREALEEFNDIVTQILTSDIGIIKSLQKAAKEVPEPVEKSGKSLSSKNLSTIKGIYDTLGTFITEHEEQDVKKEEVDMTREDVVKTVEEQVAKAIKPIVEQIEGIAKGETDPKEGDTATAEDGVEKAVTKEEVGEIVAEAVAKSMQPIQNAIAPLLKSRALPGNLNGQAEIAGSNLEKAEAHYLTGIL